MNDRPCTSLIRASVATFILAGFFAAHAQRLPDTVRPEHYTIALAPDMKSATYTGKESIEVLLKEPSSTITLNAIEITFKTVKVMSGGKEQTATVALDNDKQQATLTVPEKLPAGKATIAIEFTGMLNNELRGFYLSKTARRNYAVTQFEAVDARRAFPCFDEPALKATFDVTLVVDSGDTAISNSLIRSDTPGPGEGKHTLVFDTTPKMSTYLVAFLVGDFQCSAGDQDGVAIRVCSTPDKIALTPYSVDVAKYVLHYYNNYFGIPYPLKKLDLIALPDFEAGAMENFGAITYRENALLLDPKTASVGSRENVASVIAHEMAHQWFGDLVTMQWWDNIWLNEGFATWMSNKPLEAMHPEWKVEQYVASEVDRVLDLDTQPTTRTIRARADTPDEINQMFDGITYKKAGAVLLTVENYLGQETFRQGVHNYLAAHLYGNATAEDFWGAQTATSHKPVDQIMESLVAQPGAPILTFGEPAAGKVDVAQKRFFVSPSIHPDQAQKWTVPVCFKSGATGQDCQVLSPSATTLMVPGWDPFFANAGGKGYYRSAYPAAAYKALVANIETSLTPSERISLLGDQWAQVRANKTTAGDYLDLASAVRSDSNAGVFFVATRGIEVIVDAVGATAEERNGLAAWICSTFGPQLGKLGEPSEADSPNTRELRALLFNLLGSYGKDPAVISRAKEIAEKYIADPASVEATLGQTALVVAARNGDAALFDKLQNVYETSSNPEVQQGALRLLAMFQDSALVKRGLNYAVSDKVRNQDSAIQVSIALQDVSTRDQAWNYVVTNWDKVQAQFTTGSGAGVVESAASFCTVEARDDVQKFFAEHKVASSSVSLKHAIERINGCIELRKLQEPNLQHWLAAQTKSQSPSGVADSR
jgi:aminopeptidase N/puromycin-sensitive aminopeptidase